MADTTKAEKAEQANKPAPSCLACGDTRRVSLRMLGQDGELFRDVPCPECGPGVKLSDPAQIVTRDDLQKLASLVVLALALAAIAFLMSARGDHKHSSPFAQAVKEVKETASE